MYLRAILEHFGFRVNTTLLCDSVAACGIAQHSGVKALAIRSLWRARNRETGRTTDKIRDVKDAQG